MASKLLKNIKIFIAFKKVNALERLAYPFNFFLMVFAVLISMILSIIFIRIVFGWINSIKGWNFYEALVIAGTAMVVDGLIWVSTARIMALQHYIRTGMLDGLILKPIDTQFAISIVRGDLEDFSRIILGVSVIIFGFWNLENLGALFLFRFIEYIILLSSAFVIAYSFCIIVTSICFWTINGSGYLVTDNIFHSAQFPSDIFYQKWAKIIFSTIFPVALVATFPARALVKEFDWLTLACSLIAAVLFFVSSRYIFNKGIAVYSSASS